MFKKNIIFILPFLFHCSTFWNQRLNDAKDIFSIQLHTQSYGIKTRVSIIDFGLYYKSDEGNSFGFKSGAMGKLQRESVSIFLFGYDHFKGLKVDPRYKDELNEIKNKEITPKEIPPEKEKFLKENFEKEITNLELSKRGKIYEIYFPFGTNRKLRKTKSVFKEKNNLYIPALTDINFQIGLYYGLEINFNPGEFFDFLLGIFRIDLYNDDN